jgi:hypothetical protein
MARTRVRPTAFGNALGSSIADAMSSPDQTGANARSDLNKFNHENDPDFDTMKSIVARSIAEGAGTWDSDPLPSMADGYVNAFGGEAVLTGGRQGTVSPGSVESLRGPDGEYRVEISLFDEPQATFGAGGGNSPEQVEIVGRHMTDEEKAAYDLAQAGLDQMGQPLNGPSDYDAGTQFGKIWNSNDPLGRKLGRTWDWMNYTTPDAKQRLSNYAAQAQADAARWGRIDALRGSGLAGLAVTAGHIAGASDRTLDALAQGGGALEGVLGGAGGWKTLTLAPQMPNSQASRVRAPNGKLTVGAVDEYGRLLEQTGDGSVHRDHMPSKGALLARAEQLKGEPLSPTERQRIINGAEAVNVPAEVHREGPTYGQSRAQIESDMADLAAARQRDANAMVENARGVVSQEQFEALEAARGKLTARDNAAYDAWLRSNLDGK